MWGTAGLRTLDECFNPFRVDFIHLTRPTVARASQPWAELLNPVGIAQEMQTLIPVLVIG
jgi:hypothetical protein